LAWGKTVDEIAQEWIKIQTQKVIVEKTEKPRRFGRWAISG